MHAEEDFLVREFAEQYRAYQQRTRWRLLLTKDSSDDSRWNRQKTLCLRGLTAGSLALETLQERRKQRSQTLLMVRVGIHFSSRRQFVDNLWQVFSQEVRGLRRIDSHLCGECVDLVGTNYVLNLIRRNRFIFTHANPRREYITLAAL
jgi:hypothetical protein